MKKNGKFKGQSGNPHTQSKPGNPHCWQASHLGNRFQLRGDQNQNNGLKTIGPAIGES